MHAFDGDLLIGGSSLRDLHGELEVEQQAADSEEWLLTGKVNVPLDQAGQLAVARRYLLKLCDGRTGLVELTHLSPGEGGVLADFRPLKTKSK